MTDLDKVFQIMSKLPEELIIIDYQDTIITSKPIINMGDLSDPEIHLCIEILKEYDWSIKSKIKTEEWREISFSIIQLLQSNCAWIDEFRIKRNLSAKKVFNRTANKLKHLKKQYQRVSLAY